MTGSYPRASSGPPNALKAVALMVIALAAIPPTVSASPYALSRHLDGRIAVVALAAGGLATAVSGEDALTAAEVAGLSKAEVNWLDRSATGRYSPSAATASDALVAACALAPLALGYGNGAELRRPMAIAVIGGLVASTLLTLWIMPGIYLCVEDIRGLFRRGARRRVKDETTSARGDFS